MNAPALPRQSANTVQRVFDVLRKSPDLLTLTDIEKQTGFPRDSVQNALQLLRDQRALVTVRQADREWRYAVRASAVRPIDRRGRKVG